MKKALVTGATRQVGKAMAVALSQAGCKTYALGRDRLVLDEIRADFGIEPLAIELTERDELLGLVETMEIDTLVHAALRWPPVMEFSPLSEADIDMALEVNLSATLHLTRALLPRMFEQGAGDIVFVVPHPDITHSLIEKLLTGVLRDFAALLQSEVSKHGVSVHIVEIKDASLQDATSDLINRVSKFSGTTKK
ncbi:hypothetical protein BA893_24165 [Vibrio natriegens]|uniref:SDR family NAD(P)-dependent oxidoreductase n=1 Tax=Vibrio natriegens TaxID=691 RepID=UPI0008042321|nr:SDR family oxidoreductase [Vibrio natriegens]ANQ24690.1 hypothetical protein BA893_24165 [Vibrio natriegens]